MFLHECHSVTFKAKPPLDPALASVYKYGKHISRPFQHSSKCLSLYPSPGKPRGEYDFIPFCGEILEGTETLT